MRPPISFNNYTIRFAVVDLILLQDQGQGQWIRNVKILCSRMPYQQSELLRAATAPKTRSSPITARSPAAIFAYDLFNLTQECAQRQPAFRQLKLGAATLGRYGAGVRHPLKDCVDPDEEEVWKAVRLAGEVATFVKSQL